MTRPHIPFSGAREVRGAGADPVDRAPGDAPPAGIAPAGRHTLNALERLIFTFWPGARCSPHAAILKRAPPKVLRLATLIQQPYPVERMMERPWMLRWRLARLAPAKQGRRKLALGYGFEYMKRRLIRSLNPDYRFVFLPFGQGRAALEPAVAKAGPFTAFVWSFRDQANGLDEGFWRGNPTVRVEDGFIRSVGLGSDGALPYSLCMDRRGLYFDASRPSDLEAIATGYDFAGDPGLLERADAAIARIRRTGITKYNPARRAKATDAMAADKPGTRRRVLVIGQVEDDQSILRNRSAITTNEGLLARAIEENPDADIAFRAHPDVASGNRRALSDPESLLPAYRPEPPGRPLCDALDDCDLVYTISSLSGFEALLRGKRVKTFGGPFYAGWGLTEDAMTFPRRARRLSLRELFAAAYLIYPVYFDPRCGELLNLETVLDRLEQT